MTDYVPYTPAEYAPDAPATALHFQRWFENWIAGFEGAAGAPRLDFGALARVVPGDVIKYRNDAEGGTSSTSLTTLFSLAFLQAGTIRVKFEHRNSTNTSGSVVVRRLRDGAYTTLANFSNTTSYVARTVDCPILPGDQIEIAAAAGSSTSVFLRNRRLCNNGENLWPGFVFDIEGNTYA